MWLKITVNSKESLLKKTVDAWAVPSIAYLLIIRSVGVRSLRKQPKFLKPTLFDFLLKDDLILNHIVCKIIEKIASTSCVNVQKFLANQSDVINSLWLCFTHSSNNEQLRVTVLNVSIEKKKSSIISTGLSFKIKKGFVLSYISFSIRVSNINR